jgi:chemotaxis protein CheD
MKELMNEKQRISPGFSDPESATYAVRILPGEYFATADGTAITTLLGSCVSVCLFDRGSSVGGMNHFMLPQVMLGSNATRCADPGTAGCTNVCSARYGACAMRHLLLRLEELGASRSRLQAKLFGAGRVMAGMTDIGMKNSEFALGYLQERGIPVVASDLGGFCPRKVTFFPATGRALVKRLRDIPEGLP